MPVVIVGVQFILTETRFADAVPLRSEIGQLVDETVQKNRGTAFLDGRFNMFEPR